MLYIYNKVYSKMSFNIQKYKEIQQFIENIKQNKDISEKIVTIAVSKSKNIEIVKLALEQNIRIFGENKVQEAYEKFKDLKISYSDLRLHMIGPLQTNKVKKALEIFDYFHTLDREKLALEFVKNLESNANNKYFFIQVNTGLEDQKSGIEPKHVRDFSSYCSDELKLNIVGLMCIPPINENPEPHFLLLKKLAKENSLYQLSMGMSNDYKIALKCGSTFIRIGTQFFGKREQL